MENCCCVLCFLSVKCCIFMFYVCLRTSKVQVWGCDSSVLYVTNPLLITGIKLFRELLVTFNLCFSIKQRKFEKSCKSAQKGAFWKFSRISEILKVNRDFRMSKITSVIFSMWIIRFLVSNLPATLS